MTEARSSSPLLGEREGRGGDTRGKPDVTSIDAPAAVVGRNSASLGQTRRRGAPASLAAAPHVRTFSLNSQEFHEAVCEPREPAWIPNGALPREPRARDLPVIPDTEPASAYRSARRKGAR